MPLVNFTDWLCSRSNRAEVEDEIFSGSEAEDEGWSEEERLYEDEQLKRHSLAPIITTDSVASQAGRRVAMDTTTHSYVATRNSATSRGAGARFSDPVEDMKLAEGANALLNLAGIKTAHIVPLRSISPPFEPQQRPMLVD